MNRYAFFFLASLACLACFIPTGALYAGTGVQLFTESELRAAEVPYLSTQSLSTSGPRIAVVFPETSGGRVELSAKENLRVLVEFKPSAAGGLPEMDSLRIKVAKKFFGISTELDITDRFADYVSEDKIDVPSVDISDYDGEYRFTILLRDSNGEEGRSSFLVEVL